MKCKCGSNLFFENVYVYGWWVRLINGDGETEETNLDNLEHRNDPPKTVKCAECGKVNKNPKYYVEGNMK